MIKKHLTKKSKSLIAAKPNWLIESKKAYFKNIHEYRLFLAMLYKAYEGIDITNPFEVDIKYVTQGYRGGTEYKYIKTACENLMSRILNISEDEKGFSLRHLVRKADYRKLSGTGKLEVTFDSDVVPHIQAMFKTGKYTKIFLKHVLPMRSLYSARLYEVLLQYKDFGKRTIKLEELRLYLSVPENKLELWDNLKKKIILPAQKHLEKYTDIKFEFTSIKSGRKVTGICFKIIENTPNNSSSQKKHKQISEPKQSLSVKKATDENGKHIKIIREHLWDDSQQEIIDTCSSEKVLYYYQAAKSAEQNGLIKGSFKGFFYRILCNDHDKFEEKKKKKEAVVKAKAVKRNRAKEAIIIENDNYEKIIEKHTELFNDLSIKKQNEYISKTSMVLPDVMRRNLAVELFSKSLVASPVK